MALGIIAFACGFGFFATARQHDTAPLLGFVLGGLGIWLCIFLPGMVRFDFRNDIASIEWLKMLPISSLAVAAGELAAPVAVVSVIELVITACAAVVTGQTEIFGAVAVFLIPVNTLLFAIENFFFLLWPTAAAAAGPADVQFMGRQIATMLARLMLLAFACGIAALVGFAAALVTGRNPIAGLAVAWVSITLEAAGAIPCVAWAYDRFDVSSRPPMD
jgi:hypothetical protein